MCLSWLSLLTRSVSNCSAESKWEQKHSCAEMATHITKKQSAGLRLVGVADVYWFVVGILLKSGSSGELTALPAVYPLRDLKYSEDICHRTEILPPIYLTTLDLLTKHPWEAQMDRGKHLDFLLTAKLNRLSAIVCTDIEVTVHPLTLLPSVR